MAKRNQQNAISLFPFLAVLVCTMGALILLLLVTTRRIRNDQVDGAPANQTATMDAGRWGDSDGGGDSAAPLWANLDKSPEAQQDDFAIPTQDQPAQDAATANSDADEENPFSISLLPPTVDADEQRVAKQAELDDLQKLLQQESLRHDFLLKQIEDAEVQLNGSEPDSNSYQVQLHELTTLKQQEEELNQQLKVKQQLLVDLQTELEQRSRQTEQGEQILRQRESALISLREITKQKQQTAAAGTAETIVDFTNPSGTSRSPVVVDVSERGFEFLPAEVKLTPQDMKGFPANDNPLLAGIFAVHEARNPTTLSTQPYVLLLVRPSGSMAFYAAQRALTDANIHFGYELVEEDRRIAAGTESADETRALRQSVLAALNRRSELYGGVLARADALHDAVAKQKSRHLSVLPDGRIAAADEFVGGTDGQFYAGGAAPPPNATDAFNQFADTAPPSGEDADSRDGWLADGAVASGSAAPADEELDAWKSLTPTPSRSSEDVRPDDFSGVKAPESANTASVPQPEPQPLNAWTFGKHTGKSADEQPGGAASIAAPFSPDNGFPELVDATPAPNPAQPPMFELPAKDDAKSNAATPFSQPQPASADALALQPGGAWQGEWKDALEPMEITPSAPRAAADTVATPQSPFGKFSGSAKQHTDSESPAVAAAESDSRASAAMEEPKAVQLFPRAGQLSGNLGIGGSRSMKIPALPTAPATPSTTNGEQPKFRLFGDPAPPDSDQTETTTAETNSGEAMQPSTAYVEPSPWSPIIKKESQPNGIAKSQMTDRTSSPQRFGWPDQGTALPGSGTRTAEPPEGSFADASNTSVFGPSEIHTANPEGAASAGGVMGSGEPATEVPFLQKFLQSVEQQREPQKPDTLLLAMMEKGLRRHSSAAPKATAKSQQSKAQAAAPQAVKTQPTETRGPVRHRVEIILEKHQLTIGDFEAVDTTGWEDEQILAMVMHGLNSELEMLAEEGNPGAAPAVEFIVAPGLEDVQKMLMKQLSGIDIPTRSVKPLRNAGGSPTAKTAPAQPKAAQRNPAEPVESSKRSWTGRGLGI